MISLKKEKENIQFQFTVVLENPWVFFGCFKPSFSGRGVSYP